jgi:ParE toxin of type II toxin-antitoxin system, parDE
MAELVVFWTKTAVKQRNHILEYWIERNKSIFYSKKLISKINERISLLKNKPDLGKTTDFKKTKIITLGHYSILYQKQKNKIIITGFWDNRQDPKKLLEFLKS